MRVFGSKVKTCTCHINACAYIQDTGASMAELLLDPYIRLWVILPIVLITLLFGLIRHYITVLLRQDASPELDKIKDA